ncbi:hypothetical protein EYF80_053990 [Liparis tanakae]|uniref:Uncharacterized protein n=1 Tax=Liparis tanakae TaxID=230148 RepID=A0A4Z2F5Q7_9TELE|nr:hypothetical protein EYF80_053990 [Liparis tanakae]
MAAAETSAPPAAAAHEGVSAAPSSPTAGTSYLNTTLNSFPPRRSASHEFLMTAILRLSQLSMA